MAIGIEKIHDLVQAIGQTLMAYLDGRAGWERASLEAEAGDGWVVYRLFLFDSSGNTESVSVFEEDESVAEELSDMIEDLWHRFGDAGESPWAQAKFSLTRAGDIEIDFSYPSGGVGSSPAAAGE